MEQHGKYAEEVMKYIVVIPCHANDDPVIALESLIRQTHKPEFFCVERDYGPYLPGKKIIQTFYLGYSKIQSLYQYDFVVKLDSDIILPDNYFERVAEIFKNNPNAAIVGGVLNPHPFNDDHVRGCFKAYSAEAFQYCKPYLTMGWDTIDEMEARYYNYDVIVDKTLVAEQSRPTGSKYGKGSKGKQGEFMRAARYGLVLTVIALLKIGKMNPTFLFWNLVGYFKKPDFQVSVKLGKFIRKYRWNGIKSKLFGRKQLT